MDDPMGDPCLSVDDILRLTSVIRPLPLPLHYTPTGGNPLRNLDDDTLLSMPPQLICHVQRTASQRGLQVVSPRQVPFSSLMLRTKHAERVLGDHIVGSTASAGARWPTIDGDDMEHLLPDEPLPAPFTELVTRPKTRTEPLTKLSHESSDPVLSCMLKGRAVIDVLRRPDVCGGADEMAQLLADAWGVEKAMIDELDAFTLGFDGPLLRHAIRADEVYSTIHAPTHVRRCVSVGAVEVSRDALPQDSAVDWRRMRVHCEAVFCLSATIESIPLRYYRAIPPPGDPTAPANRYGVLAFYPAPAIAWTFEPSTFSICPVLQPEKPRGRAIPPEVLRALSRHVTLVRPMSYAMSVERRVRARKSVITDAFSPQGETISEAYGMAVKFLVVGSARGRTAAATLRNVIHTAMESAPEMLRMRIARYMRIANEEVRTHLGLRVVPDEMIVKLADRFLELGESVRSKVLAEAIRRGSSLAEWWSDITSQVPERFQTFAEGTKGWAVIGLWLAFRTPTTRWAALGRALHYSAMRETAMRSVGALALPPTEHSAERLLYAARGAVHSITAAYSGYYIGVSDVGLAIADILEVGGKPRSAAVLREASYLWTLRARCFRGTNINPIAKSEHTKSDNHLRVYAEPLDLIIAPAPYRAFEAYKSHIAKSTVLHKSSVADIMAFTGPKISEAFRNQKHAMAPCASSTLSTYLLTPWKLGDDLEAAWQMLRADVIEVATVYGKKKAPVPVAPAEPVYIPVTSYPILAPPVNLNDYYSVSALMDEDTLEWVEDMMAEGGEAFEAMVTERDYVDVDDIKRYVLKLCEETGLGLSKAPESVR